MKATLTSLLTLLTVLPLSATTFPIAREYSFEHWQNVTALGITAQSYEVSAFSFFADLSTIDLADPLTVTTFTSCFDFEGRDCGSVKVSSDAGMSLALTLLPNGEPGGTDNYNFASIDAAFLAWCDTPISIQTYQPNGYHGWPELWTMDVSDPKVPHVAGVPEPKTWGILFVGGLFIAFLVYLRRWERANKLPYLVARRPDQEDSTKGSAQVNFILLCLAVSVALGVPTLIAFAAKVVK